MKIVRMNVSKTRCVKCDLSDPKYQVVFELDGDTNFEWQTIFERNWNASLSARKADANNDYVTVICPLDETTLILPILRDVIRKTDEGYAKQQEELRLAEAAKEEAIRNERAKVQAVADSLTFDEVREINDGIQIPCGGTMQGQNER